MGESQAWAECGSTVDMKTKSLCESCGGCLYKEHAGQCPERFLVRAVTGGPAASKRAAQGGQFVCILYLVLNASGRGPGRFSACYWEALSRVSWEGLLL